MKLIAEATGGVTEKVADSGRLYQHVEKQVVATVGSVKVGGR
ncbi:hypothetical protein [Streptomyces prunicolor]